MYLTLTPLLAKDRHPREAPCPPDLGRLVSAARRGDERAWEQLVVALTPLLRRVAGGFRLQPHDVDDVVQLTWLQAYRHLGRLHTPESLSAWLSTITRRNALRLRQRGVLEVLSDDALGEDEAVPGAVWDTVVREHRADALRQAVRRLSPRQREIIEALITHDASYGAAAAQLGIPIGSIGPTRQRCLDRLRKDVDLVRAVAA